MVAAGGDVEIGWWPSARIGELQAFIDSQYRPGHVLAKDEALLRWQHPRGADELAVVGATSGGELVGILGVIPVGVCIRGRRASGAWLTTWVVAPTWRRRHVGLELLEHVLAGHEFVGTLGGNETTMRILAALRFHLRRAVPRWVLPLSDEAVARLAGRALRAPDHASAEVGEWSVCDWSPDAAAAWDDAWSSRLAPRLLGTWRDAEYLQSRYADHPRFRYRVRIARGGDGAAAALLVHRAEAVRGADAVVLRVVEALGDAEAVERLARRLAEEGRSEGAAFADFYCTGETYAQGLERAGFVREEVLPIAFPSRFQPLEPLPRSLTGAFTLTSQAAEADVFAADDVYFTRSDGDQDRPS